MKSNCCNAIMYVVGETTKYFVCDKCQKACNEVRTVTHLKTKPTYQQLANAVKYLDKIGVSKDFIKGNQEGYKRGIVEGLKMAHSSMIEYYARYVIAYSTEDTGGALITIVEQLIKQHEGE